MSAVDGRAWPGFTTRFCPICRGEAGTHREPVSDDRGEVVVYHEHDEPATGRPCHMGGKVAAIRAVAFTATDTGVDQRTTAERHLERPRGSRAAEDLLTRLADQETRP